MSSIIVVHHQPVDSGIAAARVDVRLIHHLVPELVIDREILGALEGNPVGRNHRPMHNRLSLSGATGGGGKLVERWISIRNVVALLIYVGIQSAVWILYGRHTIGEEVRGRVVILCGDSRMGQCG